VANIPSNCACAKTVNVPVQVCVKFRGRTFNGVINAVPEGPAPGGRQGPRHTGSGYMDTAAGLSSVMSSVRSGYVMFLYYVLVCSGLSSVMSLQCTHDFMQCNKMQYRMEMVM